jgi:hypothetical protein
VNVRNRLPWLVCAWLLVSLAAAWGAETSDPAKVVWHTTVESAWNLTRQQGRPLLVFVTREDCAYCVKMKDRTFSHATVAEAINRGYVPLVLDGGVPTPLLRELRVSMYPATFVISPQAVILARIDGFVPPEALASRLQLGRPGVGVAGVGTVTSQPAR